MALISVPQLFTAFGGPVKLAARLKVPLTTARYWLDNGKIPAWRMPSIEAAASEDGIVIEAPKRKRAA